MTTLVRGVLDWLLKRDTRLVTRSTQDEIEAVARAFLEPRGEWIPIVGLRPERLEKDGCIVWHVVTNRPNRGFHTNLTIDDETKAITHHFVVPY